MLSSRRPRVVASQPGAVRSERRRRHRPPTAPAANFVLDTDKSCLFNAESMPGPKDAPRSPSASPGALLQLIRDGAASTRSELVDVTGLARSTVSQRVERLISDRLLVESGEGPSTGGRPPTLLEFNKDAGVVLAADLGATHSRLAVTNLMAEPLATVGADIPIGAGPDSVLSWVESQLDELLAASDRESADVKGVGIGLPGPVEFASGRAIAPPIMPGWDGYDVRGRLATRYEAACLVDNDVNIMALGEWWAMEQPPDDFVYVKVGTGIGSGIILGGLLHRGSDGAAGDIGHIQLGGSNVGCRCGNVGCLEASAGGAALATSLARMGHATTDTRDVVRLVRAGNHEAIEAVREAGRLIGSVLATIVNVVNPRIIAIGGDLAAAGPEFLASIRQVVYRRATALSTRDLSVAPAALGDHAGITGAAAMVIEDVLSPAAVNDRLAVASSGRS